MTHYSIRLTQRAKKDIKEIWHTIADRNEPAADKMLARIHEKLEILSTFPAIGRTRPDVAQGVRHFPIGNYLLLYRIDEDAHMIHIVRIVHGARNLPGLSI